MTEKGNLSFKRKIEKLSAYFNEYYHEKPEYIFSSPGRIEIIGNHTDHNNGKVIVGSINMCILAVVKKTKQNCLIYKTKGFGEMKIDYNDLEIKTSEYGQSIGLIRGVVNYLKKFGYKLGGVEIATVTNIFKGAGVSSSAAFELLIGKILSYCYNDDQISKIDLAKIAQLSEINYFNKSCGLLDQMGISFGGVNYIDFKNVEHPVVRNLKFSLNKYQIVLINTLDSHSKLSKNYNQIKSDMNLVANYFNKKVLRMVSYNELKQNKDQLIEKLNENIYLRAEHYFEENHRVDLAFKAIKNQDEEKLISLINQSGESSFYKLKNCYVNSIEENLPKGILYSKKINLEGATRVHGGGFAGTMISFVKKSEAHDYIKKMQKMFGNRNVRKISLCSKGTCFVDKVENIVGENNNGSKRNLYKVN